MTGLRHSVLAPDLDTRRGDIVRYDTPSLFGLVVSAAWGEDDLADIAVRYKKEWNSIRLVVGVGYLWDTDETETFFRPRRTSSISNQLRLGLDQHHPESQRLFLTSVINCPSSGPGSAGLCGRAVRL